MEPSTSRRQVLPTDEPPQGASRPDAKPRLVLAQAARGKAPRHFADLNLQEAEDAVVSMGLPRYRARQIAGYYYGRTIGNLDEMSNLGASARHALRELMPTLIRPLRSLAADGGQTRKDLWALFDDAQIESVLMRYPKRLTLCVSSQVGCGMGCPFCATGQLGLTRNLSTAEILEQVRQAIAMAQKGLVGQGSARLSNVVFMGMGEPLANYRAVVSAIRRIIAPVPDGFGLSARGITVSTVGLVPAIDRLAAEGLPVTLAVSLHAPDDELRDQLIPVNSRWKVGELLDSAHRYYQATSRRVSIEYALIKDMNDHRWRAELLAQELNARGRGWAHVNPIGLNPTSGSIWTASRLATQRAFVDTLLQAGIATSLRDTRGSDIDGACGQLAARAQQEQEGQARE